jgi:hypothetical protein
MSIRSIRQRVRGGRGRDRGRYGLTPAQLALDVRRLLVGVPVGNVQVDGRPLPVVMRVDSGGQATGGSLEALRLALPGNPSIDEVADIQLAEGPAVVTRVDQRAAATVTATIMGTDLTGVSNEVKDIVATVEGTPGTDVRIGGIFAQQEEAFSDLYLAMAIGVLIVYLVMVASLGSLVNPLIVLFSLPFVSIGAFLALLLTGRDLGLPALMGFLMLIGIVVTNAIVLINFVEMLRERGLPAGEALIEGARSRVRPILMTALATISPRPARSGVGHRHHHRRRTGDGGDRRAVYLNRADAGRDPSATSATTQSSGSPVRAGARLTPAQAFRRMARCTGAHRAWRSRTLGRRPSCRAQGRSPALPGRS